MTSKLESDGPHFRLVLPSGALFFALLPGLKTHCLTGAQTQEPTSSDDLAALDSMRVSDRERSRQAYQCLNDIEGDMAYS